MEIKIHSPFLFDFFHRQYFKLELVSLCSLTTSFLYQWEYQRQVGGQKYCILVMIGSMSEQAGMLDDVFLRKWHPLRTKSDFFFFKLDRFFYLAHTEEFWLFQCLSGPLYLKHLRKKNWLQLVLADEFGAKTRHKEHV